MAPGRPAGAGPGLVAHTACRVLAHLHNIVNIASIRMVDAAGLPEGERAFIGVGMPTERLSKTLPEQRSS